MASMNNHGNQEAENKSAEIKEESFDLTGLLIDYLNNWKFFVLSLIICLGATYCYIRTIVPTFKVGAAVYINDDNATKTSAVSLSANNPMIDMKEYIDETEIEILKSRNSLLKIVDTLQLSYSYYAVGKWCDVPIYRTNPIIASMDSAALSDLKFVLTLDINKKSNNQVMVGVTYGPDYKKSTKLDKLLATIETPAGNVTLTPNGPLYDEVKAAQRIIIRNPNAVAASMAGSLNVQYAKKASTIVNFDYVTPLPNLGTDVLKMIIYFYNRQIIEDKNRSAIQTEEFIQARLKDIQDELKGVEENLREYRERHNIANQEAQISMSLHQKSTTETQINDLLVQERVINDLLSEANSIEISTALEDLRHLPAITSNQAINMAVEKFNRDIDQYNRQRRDMTAESDLIVRLISGLREQRAQIVRSLESAKRSLSDQRRGITTIENRSASTLAAQPTVDKGLQEIFRDQSVKANIYTFLLQKREEIALQKTLATPTAQFIDNPSVMAQVAPQTPTIYLTGLIIGLLIPGVIIYLRRQLFPKFKEKEDLMRITDVPIIGEICKADIRDGEVVIGENVSTSAAELFRLLRNNVNFANATGEKKVILLTSAISGEGKTFVALNLAMTYALTKKKVVVLGLDIRRPVLAHKFNMSNRVGVTSYLSDQVSDVNDIIFPSEINPYLYIIPAGPIPPNPNELLLSERMEELFNQLRQEFDYIIVDTAPLGLVSDSFLIIPHTDVQLFVTRANYSTRKGIRVLHEAIKNGQMPKSYIVLNSVNTRSRAYQYRRYGYYSSNRSRYGYGYAEDGESHHHSKKKKKSFFKRLFGK